MELGLLYAGRTEAECKVLGKVLGPKTEVTRDWRRLHMEAFHDVYCSPGTLQLSIPRITRWGRGLVTCWEKGDLHTGFWWY